MKTINAPNAPKSCELRCFLRDTPAEWWQLQVYSDGKRIAIHTSKSSAYIHQLYAEYANGWR